MGIKPEEELANKIDENSERFERWKKTTDEIPLKEFKQAIEFWKQNTQESTDMLGQDVPIGSDKISYNLAASHNAFNSVLLWGASLELYARRLEKELSSSKKNKIKKNKTKKTKKRKK